MSLVRDIEAPTPDIMIQISKALRQANGFRTLRFLQPIQIYGMKGLFGIM